MHCKSLINACTLGRAVEELVGSFAKQAKVSKVQQSCNVARRVKTYYDVKAGPSHVSAHTQSRLCLPLHPPDAAFQLNANSWFKYKLPIYKYELSIYKCELSIYKYVLLIYKYELSVYKYAFRIYKHSNEFRNKAVDLYKHELCIK